MQKGVGADIYGLISNKKSAQILSLTLFKFYLYFCLNFTLCGLFVFFIFFMLFSFFACFAFLPSLCFLCFFIFFQSLLLFMFFCAFCHTDLSCHTERSEVSKGILLVILGR